MIVWFTRQPGAGKSTLADTLAAEFRKRGHRVTRIDGDEFRRETGNTDFSESGRIRNVEAGQERAAELAAEGFVVLASFVSPHRSVRERFKASNDVLEVYTHTPLPGSKDRFRVAYYEPPIHCFLDLDTSTCDVSQCISIILNALHGTLKTPSPDAPHNLHPSSH